MRPNEKKITNQKKHSVNRALERYSIELTDDLRAEIINKILTRDCEFVSRRKRRLVYIVEIKGQRVPVVYDRSTKEICSFLPWDKVVSIMSSFAKKNYRR